MKRRTDWGSSSVVGGHVVAVVDSGHPRGERRWWHLLVNGYAIHESTNGSQVDALAQEVRIALGKLK